MFVWIEDCQGVVAPVNPALVAYLRLNTRGETCLVFGAVAGGFHEVAVRGTVAEVVALLDGVYRRPAPAQTPPSQRLPRARRAPSQAT